MDANLACVSASLTVSRVFAALFVLIGSVGLAAPVTVSFGAAGSVLPARLNRGALEARVTDSVGQTWSWTSVTSGALVGPGMTLVFDVRWRQLVVGLQADLSFVSFADENGKRGKLYGANVLLPLGLRQRLGPLELAAFVAPTIVFGGAGIGSFARQAGAPIQFVDVRFFDDETALHLLETTFAVTAGLDVRLELRRGLSAFVSVSGVQPLVTDRAWNIAGYADEAQSQVQWHRRAFTDPAIDVRFDGERLADAPGVLGFDGPRVSAGLVASW